MPRVTPGQEDDTFLFQVESAEDVREVNRLCWTIYLRGWILGVAVGVIVGVIVNTIIHHWR